MAISRPAKEMNPKIKDLPKRTNGGLSMQTMPTAAPQPKNFSESLMNALARQNIGQAFSENPVEALGILNRKNENSAQ